MTSPIRVQVFLVRVAASVMPPLSAAEVEEAVRHLAFTRERPHGMGALDVSAFNFNEHAEPMIVTDWTEVDT